MKHHIPLQNIKCGGCVNTVTEELSKLASISEVHVELETSVLTFETDLEDLSVVSEKLKAIGYPPQNKGLTGKLKALFGS